MAAAAEAKGRPVVAIGDVHGCFSLLVLERIRELRWQPEAWGLAGVTVLRGNHEQMLLDALAEEEPGEATELWEWNGGKPELLARLRQHQPWFEALQQHRSPAPPREPRHRRLPQRRALQPAL